MLKASCRVVDRLNTVEAKAHRGLYRQCDNGEKPPSEVLDAMAEPVRPAGHGSFGSPFVLATRQFTFRTGPGFQPLPGLPQWWLPDEKTATEAGGQPCILVALLPVSEMMQQDDFSSLDATGECIEKMYGKGTSKDFSGICMARVCCGQALWVPGGWVAMLVGNGVAGLTVARIVPHLGLQLWTSLQGTQRELIASGIKMTVAKQRERAPWKDIGEELCKFLA